MKKGSIQPNDKLVNRPGKTYPDLVTKLVKIHILANELHDLVSIRAIGEDLGISHQAVQQKASRMRSSVRRSHE